jgi:hypothetical protein
MLPGHQLFRVCKHETLLAVSVFIVSGHVPLQCWALGWEASVTAKARVTAEPRGKLSWTQAKAWEGVLPQQAPFAYPAHTAKMALNPDTHLHSCGN